MGLHGVAMKQAFAAAAQGHAGRRADYRKRRELERLKGILALFDHILHHRPSGEIYGKQREAQIDPDRKIAALVVQHQCFEILAHCRNGFADHAQDVRVDGVHLAVKLEAGNAVANIPKTGGPVSQDGLASAFDVAEQQHARRPLDRHIGAIRREILQAPLIDAIETAVFGGKTHQLRNGFAFRCQAFSEPLGADFVDQLERSHFPGISELHGIIDSDHRIGDFGNEICRVDKRR